MGQNLNASSVRLVFFPGEGLDPGGTTRGHIYVYADVGNSGRAASAESDGNLVSAYEAVGGPPPGMGHADIGGHTAGVTPAGDYVLGPAEHHTSQNWPASVVPWGAALRKRPDGEIEYQPEAQKTWILATGPDGAVTRALVLFDRRTAAQQGGDTKLTDDALHDLIEEGRAYFYDDAGNLLPGYNRNDFGKWSFNLTQGGQRTEFFLHTTPDDEEATLDRRAFRLSQSHGCIHIRPSDRDEMMGSGYLQAGVHMRVMPYGQTGPLQQLAKPGALG